MNKLNVDLNGFRWLKNYLSKAVQRDLVDELQILIEKAPLFQPVMPRTGKPFSVYMTNAGPLGWVSDRAGYRYQEKHPVTGETWPAMPQALYDLWQELSDYSAPPEACLINVYDRAAARMGLHVDNDEADLSAPILSISLGDDARFRLGGLKRNDPTKSIILNSGDVVLIGGKVRLAYHGIDRIKWGSSTLWPGGGRVNITLRRATKLV